MHTLRLLGGARLHDEGGAPLRGPASQRHRLALLALLDDARPDGLSRDKLVAYLWPERDAANGRNLLKQSVHAVRAALGDGALVATGDVLRLDPALVASDAAAFRGAIASGDHGQAVALYRGPFLDGFFLRGSPEFERWADAVRARLAGAHADALEALAAQAEDRADARAAVEWWRARAALDPYDTRVAARLMRALERSGNAAAALQHAALHQRTLETELGLPSAPEVAALAERMRSAPAPATPSALPAEAPEAHDASADEPAPARRVPRPRRARALPAVAAVGVLLLLGAAGVLPRLRGRPGATHAAADAPASAPMERPRVLAVLPFRNLSGDPGEEFVSDGLTEELTGVLARASALRVVARTSAFAFKGSDRDVREIGRTLGAHGIVEGSVRREGQRVRVTARLVDVRNGLLVWSGTFERAADEILALQSDLALRIASALQAELTPDERTRLARRATERSEAHELYLKGRYFWNQRSRAGFAKAVEYLERAIRADPAYAAPHAWLAMAYSLQGLSGYLPPQEARRRMRDEARRAVQMDETLADAHAALAAYLNMYEWDNEGSEREHRRAIELDPSYGLAHNLYANLLLATGRPADAVAHKRRALELDPLVPANSEMLGAMLLRAGHPDEALPYLRSAVELDSTFWRGHANLGAYHESRGAWEEAVRAHRTAVALGGGGANAEAGLARSLARAGRVAEARRRLAALQAEARRIGIHAPATASVLLALGDRDAALAWLEQSYRERHPELRLLRGNLSLAPLERDPRYQDLLRRVGLATRDEGRGKR